MGWVAGQSPALMSPQGRGQDAGAGRGWWRIPVPRVAAARPGSHQEHWVTPQGRRSFLTAAGLGDAPGECKAVQSCCCSGHRAAIPLPQLLAAREATTKVTMGSLMSPLASSPHVPPSSTGSPCGAAVHPPRPTPTQCCLSMGVPPLFHAQPGPAMAASNPASPGQPQ